MLQLSFEQVGGPFAREAPIELLREPAPLQRRIWEEVDAFIVIWAPENAREGADLSDERRSALQQMSTVMRERTMAMAVPWVIAEYPVESLGAGRGDDARGVQAVHLRRRAARLGRRGGADARDRRRLRRGRRGAHRRRRHRSDDVARRPHRRGRRRAHQHAGRRGLLLAGRGLGRGRDRVLRVPGRLLRARGRRARASCSRRARRRRHGARRRGRS